MFQFLARVLVPLVQLLTQEVWAPALIGVALAVGACGARRGDGRWRWLGAASAGWLALALSGLAWPALEPWPHPLVLAALTILVAVSVLAVLRAIGFLSSSQPLAFRVIALLVIGVAVGVVTIPVWKIASEEFYPWTDWSAPHAVLHMVNDSDAEIGMAWRWADDVEHWVPVSVVPRQRGLVPARTSDVEQLGPMCATSDLHRPWTEKTFDLPPGFSKEVVVRIKLGQGVVEHSFTASLDSHALLHITSDQRVLFTHGRESWLGAPVWAGARELPLP